MLYRCADYVKAWLRLLTIHTGKKHASAELDHEPVGPRPAMSQAARSACNDSKTWYDAIRYKEEGRAFRAQGGRHPHNVTATALLPQDYGVQSKEETAVTGGKVASGSRLL